MAGSAYIGPKIVQGSLDLRKSLEDNRNQIQDEIGFLMLIGIFLFSIYYL